MSNKWQHSTRMSDEVHGKVELLAKKYYIPKCVVVENLILNNECDIDWYIVQRYYYWNLHASSQDAYTRKTLNKIKNIMRNTGYNTTDEELCEESGINLNFIRTVTHSAQKDCVTMLSKGICVTVDDLKNKCKISRDLAIKMIRYYNNPGSAPSNIAYIFDKDRIWATDTYE